MWYEIILQALWLILPVYVANASAVIVGEDWEDKCPAVLIRVKDVDRAFDKAVALFAPPPPAITPGIHPTAVIAGDVRLGKDVAVGPYCVLEPGVRVGDRTVISAGCYLGHGTVVGKDGRLYPHVSVREGTCIGDRAIIHSGVVIGSDGYGFVPEEKNGKLVITKIPQTGTVEIGDDVEIGANATIDRARFGKTRIGNSVKIDNLVQVGHNVVVGDCSGIVAQVGISGSTTIGSRVLLYGQAGVAGHLHIGDGAVIGAQAGVSKDVAPGAHVRGTPAMPDEKMGESHANVMRLPHLKKRVAELERRLAETEKKIGAGGRG